VLFASHSFLILIIIIIMMTIIKIFLFLSLSLNVRGGAGSTAELTSSGVGRPSISRFDEEWKDKKQRSEDQQ